MVSADAGTAVNASATTATARPRSALALTFRICNSLRGSNPLRANTASLLLAALTLRRARARTARPLRVQHGSDASPPQLVTWAFCVHADERGESDLRRLGGCDPLDPPCGPLLHEDN